MRRLRLLLTTGLLALAAVSRAVASDTRPPAPPPSRCVVGAGAFCGGVEPACECAAGLFCDFAPDPRGSPPRCMPAVPCVVEGRTYQPRETFPCDCNTCTCISGERVGSTLLLCGPVRRP